MKFKKQSKSWQEIPTAALPEIIFMMSTVVRETDLLVEQKLPRASQLRKLERKSLVSYFYIGKPKNTQRFGSEPKIQVNDVFIEVNNIPMFVQGEIQKIPESEQSKMTMALKVDRDSKMGLLIDVQEKLQEIDKRKLLYNSFQSDLNY
ncbi:biopolymer transporter ExbD [Fulvivirgaceae bacterium BMA10]|uniref:Biopolymer transporter ExbD n=1 Tax=Splendidivirga corallicola TaxID=3051826 RepID=A0ABT8KRW8_9BACT|nr:biopolymer transporter ExbD [Fulvivirgaceae bacterium BMA10]